MQKAPGIAPYIVWWVCPMPRNAQGRAQKAKQGTLRVPWDIQADEQRPHNKTFVIEKLAICHWFSTSGRRKLGSEIESGWIESIECHPHSIIAGVSRSWESSGWKNRNIRIINGNDEKIIITKRTKDCWSISQNHWTEQAMSVSE